MKIQFNLTLGPVVPGAPMVPSTPLIPCETYCRHLKIDAEAERFFASAQLHEELIIFAAYLGAWDPLFPFWTWRSW